ncbi:uncharacterized protein LOC144753732 [Lissotriton helveticus]
MWPITNSRPSGLLISSRTPRFATNTEVQTKRLITFEMPTEQQQGLCNKAMELKPLKTQIKTFSRDTPTYNEVTYDYAEKTLETSRTKSNPEAIGTIDRTASGYFINFDDSSEDLSESKKQPSTKTFKDKAKELFKQLKETYLISPWIEFWVALGAFILILWLIMVLCLGHFIEGKYAKMDTASQKINLVLKPHTSSHVEKRELSSVNFTANPIPGGIAWDNTDYEIHGPVEILKYPHQIKISLSDFVKPSSFADDWDFESINDMMSDLVMSAKFTEHDYLQGSSNYDEMFCYNHYGNHYLHKSAQPRNVLNYNQWEHCATPPKGSSRTFYDKYSYFSGFNTSNAETFYFKLSNKTGTKTMLTNTKLIYPDSFFEQMNTFGFDFWNKNVEAKTVWGTKEWQVQGIESLFRACMIPEQIIFLNDTIQQTTCLGLAKIKDLNKPSIPKPTMNSNSSIDDEIDVNYILNQNRTHPDWKQWLIWPTDTNNCQDRFLNKIQGFTLTRPDPRYSQRQHPGIITTYSVGKLCLQWLQTSTLAEIKQHLTLLTEGADLRDFIMGPRKQRQKRFIAASVYADYNEAWKITQIETAERIREIDRINLEKSLSVVDNGLMTLSSRIYSLDSIVSSAIDIISQDLLLLQHGQSQLRSIVQLGWTLQNLRSGYVPWRLINTTSLFNIFNLTDKQISMAQKGADYSILSIEKLERLLLTMSERPVIEWIIHGVINIPISTFRSQYCQKYIQAGQYEKMGKGYIKSAWNLPYTHACVSNKGQKVFLSGNNCAMSLSGTLLCQGISLHGACEGSSNNLSCHQLGTPATQIEPFFRRLSNGSYILIVDRRCCSLLPGKPYLITTTAKVMCCERVLFPSASPDREARLWPNLKIASIRIDTLSRMKTVLLQTPTRLTSSKETYDLQVARTTAEIHSLLSTNSPIHFAEILNEILNISDTTGVSSVFKAVFSGALTPFKATLGIFPDFVHSIFGGLPLLLGLVAGILFLILLFRYGKPCHRQNTCDKGRNNPSHWLPGPDI